MISSASREQSKMGHPEYEGRSRVGKSVIAGAAYFGCVFAAGFALGVVRTMWIMPLVGDTGAVAIELPVILAIAWIVCRWLTGRLEVPIRVVSRAVMGVVAFALLMAGELSISMLLGGRSPTEHLQLYRQTSHILGFTGQIASALLPVLQIWTAGSYSTRGRERR